MTADALEQFAYDRGLDIEVDGDLMFVRHRGRDFCAALPSRPRVVTADGGRYELEQVPA